MRRIDQYWTDRFGLTDELSRPGVHVVPHARYTGDDLVFVFVKGETAVLSVHPSRAAGLGARATQVPCTRCSIPLTSRPCLIDP